MPRYKIRVWLEVTARSARTLGNFTFWRPQPALPSGDLNKPSASRCQENALLQRFAVRKLGTEQSGSLNEVFRQKIVQELHLHGQSGRRHARRTLRVDAAFWRFRSRKSLLTVAAAAASKESKAARADAAHAAAADAAAHAHAATPIVPHQTRVFVPLGHPLAVRQKNSQVGESTTPGPFSPATTSAPQSSLNTTSVGLNF